MKLLARFIAVVVCWISFSAALLAAEQSSEQGEDSSAGLPDQYAKNYLVAASTISPDKKFAVIYPTEDPEEVRHGGNYLVSLQPFAVLGKLDTKWPYFKNESHGGLSADWSDDSSVALVTLDGKWGPHDVFLLELRDGKLARATNILAKAHDLLLPSYRKSKAEPYNDNFDFIFDGEEGPVFKVDGTTRVVIDGDAVTDPKGLSRRSWRAHLKASWNIPQAKFTSQKITRTTAKEND
jgi:hypothetical protein